MENQILTKKDIEDNLNFLGRVDLKGQEAGVFMNLVNKLKQLHTIVSQENIKPQVDSPHVINIRESKIDKSTIVANSPAPDTEDLKSKNPKGK